VKRQHNLLGLFENVVVSRYKGFLHGTRYDFPCRERIGIYLFVEDGQIRVDSDDVEKPEKAGHEWFKVVEYVLDVVCDVLSTATELYGLTHVQTGVFVRVSHAPAARVVSPSLYRIKCNEFQLVLNFFLRAHMFAM